MKCKGFDIIFLKLHPCFEISHVLSQSCLVIASPPPWRVQRIQLWGAGAWCLVPSQVLDQWGLLGNSWVGFKTVTAQICKAVIQTLTRCCFLPLEGFTSVKGLNSAKGSTCCTLIWKSHVCVRNTHGLGTPYNPWRDPGTWSLIWIPGWLNFPAEVPLHLHGWQRDPEVMELLHSSVTWRY